MPYKTLKTTHRNLWAILQYVGLKTEGVRAVLGNYYYGSGRYSYQLDDAPFTGKVELAITMGGLRTKEAPPAVKALFKKKVVPVLAKSIAEFGEKFSGKMVLHFNGGILTDFTLTP